jgi:hypothetical protein
MSGCTSECMSECMSECVSECMSECMSEYMSECISECCALGSVYSAVATNSVPTFTLHTYTDIHTHVHTQDLSHIARTRIEP